MIYIKIFLGVDHQGAKLKDSIIKYLESNGIEIVDKVGKADFGVVIGGDGTLLRAFKSFIFKKNLHVIAINAVLDVTGTDIERGALREIVLIAGSSHEASEIVFTCLEVFSTVGGSIQIAQ